MKTTNLALLVTYVYLIIFFVLGMKLYLGVEESNVIYSFKNKIELALDSATMINYDSLSDEDKEKASSGNFDDIELDKNLIYETFINVLSLNCFKSEMKSVDLSKYIDKLMLIDKDGILINYENQNGQREWTDLIPYSSDDGITYSLSENEEAVMKTIRRNLVIEKSSSNIICLPFEDEYGKYKPITHRSVIVSFKDCPIRRNKKENIIMFSGVEYKNLNKKDAYASFLFQYICNMKGYRS